MNKIFQFVFEGITYVSFSGVTSVQALLNGTTNVLAMTTLNQLYDIRDAIAGMCGLISTDDLPILTDVTGSIKDGIANVTGNHIKDGDTQKVTVTDTDTYYGESPVTVPEPLPIPATPVTEPLLSADTSKSLKLSIGTKGAAAGIQIRGNDPHRITVSLVLQQLSDKDLHTLYRELSRRFKDAEPVAQTTEIEPEPRVEDIRRPKYTRETVVQPVEEAVTETPVQTVFHGDDMKELGVFLDTLTPEVKTVLQEAPYGLLKSCTASTAKALDPSSIEDGDEYCATNKWQRNGDYYAIDNFKDMNRYFYSVKTKIFTVVPVMIISKFRKLNDVK